MSNALRTRNENKVHVRDPFGLMRSFFGYDPFYGVEARAAKPSFVPSFEAKETEDSYVLLADVPGIKEDDLDISLHGNVLTVSGSRKADERTEGETWFLYERQYGAFSRSFSLPDEANGEAVEAGLKDGVLTVRIGKKSESKPRKINLSK